MSLGGLLHRTLLKLGRSNLIISLAAACAGLSTMIFIRHVINWSLITVIFFGTITAYNGQRLISDFFYSRTVRTSQIVFVCIGLTGLFPFLFLLIPAKVLLLGVSGALAIAYALPLPYSGKKRSLRDLPYLKIWIIVLVWLLSTTIVPALSGLKEVGLGYFILWIVHQGLFIFSLTLPFDIRDLQADTSDQRTIPMIIGIERTIILAIGALVLAACILLGLAFFEIVTYRSFLLQIPLYLLCILALSRGNKHRDPFYYLIVLDGFIILQALLLVLSRQI